MMMDCVVPGGVALDLDERGEGMLLRAVDEIDAAVATLHRHHGSRLLAGRLHGRGAAGLALMKRYGAGGPVSRAAGLGFDARMLVRLDAAMPGETGLRILGADPSFAPALGQRDDALGRQHLRIDEIAASLSLLRSALRTLPAGALTVALPPESGEGIGWAESARGDIWHWLRLDHGQIAACFPRDPTWALWPVLDAALAGADVEDADLIRASFALTVSGMDL
jgi:Ni,Fe-hydrogenase III large subunit